MNDNPVLDSLLIVEIKDTFWFRYYYLRGTLIKKQFFIELYFEFFRVILKQYYMSAKVSLGKRLLMGCGDACPYCAKLIDIPNWKKWNHNDPT